MGWADKGPSAAGAFYSRPSSLGYWRGSGTNAGLSGLGGDMPNTSSGIFAAPGKADSGWSPSVLYLLILIVAEMFVFGFIARALR